MSTIRSLFLSLVLATPFFLTACGPGSPGTMKALMAPPSDSALDRYTLLNIDLTEGAGNAFARFMLAGLGQIHIDANVFLEDLNSHAELRKYLITKTFAWGGFYGLGTRITDVEEGFTEGVVAAILGESDTTKPEPNK